MPVNDKYTEVQIEFDKTNYNNIYIALYLSGIKNILEEEKFIKIYLPESGKNPADEIKNFLISTCNVHPGKIKAKEFKNRDWDKEWKKSLKPVIIKDKIIISPGHKNSLFKSKPGSIIIEIEPKMSFGTGHNETTRLVLEFLAGETDNNDKYMLDYGCGTGILAIAGIKLGLKKAVAIDIDSDSIQNAKEYIESNGVKSKIKLYKKNITGISEKDFDIICINIIRSVIEDNLDCISSKLKKNGKLFISGILREEVNKVSERLIKSGFLIKKIKMESEWAGIYARKI